MCLGSVFAFLSPPSLFELHPAAVQAQWTVLVAFVCIGSVLGFALPLAFRVAVQKRNRPFCYCRGQAGGGGVFIIMHGRSRMTMDPRIPTMPGRSTSGFTDQADIASTKREAP